MFKVLHLGAVVEDAGGYEARRNERARAREAHSSKLIRSAVLIIVALNDSSIVAQGKRRY